MSSTNGATIRRALIPFATLLCATSAVAAASNDDAELPLSTAMASSAVEIDPPFADEFSPFVGPRPSLQLPDTAVDLDTFDPPLEPEATGRSIGSGVASFYGRRFHGRRTASGERFDMNAMTAAHKTLPFGTRVLVTNPRNGKSVVVRINDRGPFIRGRHIDLSRAAAKEIGMVSRGHAKVDLAILD